MAPVTRSQSRASGVQLLSGVSGVSGVSREKKYNCIICKQKCSTKQGLTSHFRTHKALPFNQWSKQRMTPYADPSCWPRKDVTLESIHEFKTKERNLKLRRPPTEAPSGVWRDWNEESRMVSVLANTTKEADVYEEVRGFRLWNWWFNAQEWNEDDTGKQTKDDRLQRMLETNRKDFEIVGDAGADDKRCRLNSNTFHEAIQIPDQPTLEDDYGSRSFPIGSSVTPIRRDYEQHWRLWRERGQNGRLVADFELPLRGPLNREAIIQCLSEATTSFAAKQGETNEARAQLGNAVAEYLDNIFQHYDDVDAAQCKEKHATDLGTLQHHNWRENHDDSSMSPAEIATRTMREDQWYAQAFRDARAGFSDTMIKATNIYFEHFGREQFMRGSVHFDHVLQATETYAAALGDTEVKQKLDVYRTPNGHAWRTELVNKYGWGKR